MNILVCFSIILAALFDIIWHMYCFKAGSDPYGAFAADLLNSHNHVPRETGGDHGEDPCQGNSSRACQAKRSHIKYQMKYFV